MQFLPLREIPFKNQVFKKGDVFVLFGELFDCGYVNGLLDSHNQKELEGISLKGKKHRLSEIKY